MQKILFVIITLFVYTIQTSCVRDKPNIIIKNNSDCVIVLSGDSLLIFQKRTSMYNIFQNSFANNSFYSDFSTKFGCYDRNRKDFRVFINVFPIKPIYWKITSKDSCTNNNLNLSDSLFYEIKFDDACSKWDSLKIYAELDQSIIDTLFLRERIGSFKAIDHPFTIHEEIHLLCSTGINLYYTETTNEYPIKISVYYNGQIIKYSEGNMIPILFNSMSKLIQNCNVNLRK